MSYSELMLLSGDILLEYSAEKTALVGEKRGFPIFIADDFNAHEYVITIFVKIPVALDDAVRKRIVALSERLPKNALLGQESELNYLRIRLMSTKLFQENGFFLVEFVDGLCEYLSSAELQPAEINMSICEAHKHETRKKSKRESRLKTTRFDKYSLRGIIGAFFGAVVFAFIQGVSLNSGSNNLAVLVAGAVLGAAAMLVIMLNYKLLAKKLDVAGIVSTTVLAAVFIVFSMYLVLINTIGGLAAAAEGVRPGLMVIAGDFAAYLSKYANIAETDMAAFAGQLALTNLLGAALAAGGFYRWYFGKNTDEMYGGSNKP